MDTEKFKYKEITNTILKSFYEVYNELGDGFLESVYESAWMPGKKEENNECGEIKSNI